MHRGVGGAVSEDDDVLGEPDGKTEGEDRVRWMGQVISIYPYAPLNIFYLTPASLENAEKSEKSNLSLQSRETRDWREISLSAVSAISV